MPRRANLRLLVLTLCVLALRPVSALTGEETRGAAVRYIVFEIGDDGTLRPRMHRIVRLSSERRSLTSGEVASRLARPSRDEESVHVRLFADAGEVVFEDVVRVPRWARTEPAAYGEAGERTLLPARRAFAVRVPVRERSWLALSIGRDGEKPREPAFRDAEFDVDALAADERLPLARFTPRVELRSAAAANSGNRVDLLIMGDGYTSAEQTRFDADAANVVASFFDLAPYDTYRNFFNTATLFTASSQSGADHPPYSPGCVPTSPPTCCADPIAQSDPKSGTFVTTAFDAAYCYNNTHRALAVDPAKVLAAAAAHSDWDEIIVIVNDPTHGATGGIVSTISTAPTAVNSAQHEIGHSFSGLADEYDLPYPGYPFCSDLTSPPCEPNVTDQTNRSLIKWNDWIAASTPVPTPDTGMYESAVGLFEGARYLTGGYYRPRQTCLMRALGQPFCEVCRQEFVFQLYRGGWGVPESGIDLIEPGSESPAPGLLSIPFPGSQSFSVGTLEPTGGTISTSWYVDGAQVPGATGSSFHFTPAAEGPHQIEVRVTDTTGLVRDAAGAGVSLTSSRVWTVVAGEPLRVPIPPRPRPGTPTVPAPR